METKFEDEIEETAGKKIKTFLVNNVMYLAIVGIAIVWTLRGIINIEESGKTLAEIILESILGFVLSFAIGYLLKFKGVQDGMNSDVFHLKQKQYEDLVEQTRNDTDCLDVFCDMKNHERYESAQRWLIKKATLSWNKFINNEYANYKNDSTLTKKQKKLVRKTYEMSIPRLSTALLLSTSRTTGKSNDDVSKMNKTVGGYLGKGVVLKFGFIIISVIFAFYQPNPNDTFKMEEMIWRALEVFTYILTGMIGYFTSKFYITTTLVGTMFDTRIIYLKEFLNAKQKDPNKFEKHLMLENKENENAK